MSDLVTRLKNGFKENNKATSNNNEDGVIYENSSSATRFQNFSRQSQACSVETKNKKPIPPPKPSFTQRSNSDNGVLDNKPRPGKGNMKQRKSTTDVYIEAMPVKKEKVKVIENQDLYDTALAVCKDKLDGDERGNAYKSNSGYEVINFPASNNSSCQKNGSHDRAEPIYEEPPEPWFDEPPSPGTPTRNDAKGKGYIPKESDLFEVCSEEEEDNPDTTYYSLQKFKHHSRFTWIDKVESMHSKDRFDYKKSLERVQSHPCNFIDDIDDEFGDYTLSMSNRDVLDMRLTILKNMIKDERSYADKLKKISEQAHLSSLCIPSAQKDIELTLKVISDLLYLHKTFSKDLEKAVTSHTENIGIVIEKFVNEELIQAKEYTRNYHAVLSTTMKHRHLLNNVDSNNSKKKEREDQTENNECKFLEEPKQEVVQVQSFIDSLSLPLWRFQNCTHTLKKLTRYTPLMHTDYEYLQKAHMMAKSFIDEFSVPSSLVTEQRYLVKKGLVVEQYYNNERKLRHLFLFNDVVVCAKQKITDKFSVRWFIPLCYLILDEKLSALEDRQAAQFHQEKTNSLKKSLIRYQAEYAKEFKKIQFVVKNTVKNKKLDISKKKLMEQEAELILNSPYLKLSLTSSHLKKTYTILMASDYERAAWKSAISSYVTRAKPNSKITLSQVHLLINDMKVSPPSSCPRDIFQSSRIDGLLKLTIHKFLGLQTSSRVFCSVEIDSFGHFFLNAKTNTITGLEPEWNEDFEIDLEGAQTLRILCYQIGQGSDVHLGSIALELNEAWLKEKFIEENFPISNNMFLKISIEYSNLDDLQSFKSKNKHTSGSYFGVPLEEITRRENRNIPLLITSCVEEIQKRGMKELGLYRVSGLSFEIRKLQTAFNRNSVAASTSLSEVDTNVLTGIIKLFLRELPDPLFPGAKYNNFIKCLLNTSTQADDLAHELIRLPQPNFETIQYLLRHLVKVSEQEKTNKMTTWNLATIFGPNLLKNPLPIKNSSLENMLSNSTVDATRQCKITLQLLTMVANGYSFSKDTDI